MPSRKVSRSEALRGLGALTVTLLVMGSALPLGGCGVYSFTGTNLSPDVRTITIPNFENVSGNGPPTLGQVFSERVRDYFQRNTRLDLVPGGGDLILEGQIVGYELSPLPATANDVASQMRLTIRVKTNYVNTRDEEQNFDETFSFFADFPAQTNLTSIEQGLIAQITEQLIVQMFNRSVANW